RTLFGDEKTVWRGGYQISYDTFFNNLLSNIAADSPNTLAATPVPPPAGPGAANFFPTSIPSSAPPPKPATPTPAARLAPYIPDSTVREAGRRVQPEHPEPLHSAVVAGRPKGNAMGHAVRPLIRRNGWTQAVRYRGCQSQSEWRGKVVPSAGPEVDPR